MVKSAKGKVETEFMKDSFASIAIAPGRRMRRGQPASLVTTNASGEDAMDDFAIDVRQPKVSPGVAIN